MTAEASTAEGVNGAADREMMMSPRRDACRRLAWHFGAARYARNSSLHTSSSAALAAVKILRGYRAPPAVPESVTRLCGLR